MKKFEGLFILPFFAAASLVGSGFCLWIFSPDVIHTSIDGRFNLLVEEKVEESVGTLNVDDNAFSLEVNQNGISTIGGLSLEFIPSSLDLTLEFSYEIQIDSLLHHYLYPLNASYDEAIADNHIYHFSWGSEYQNGEYHELIVPTFAYQNLNVIPDEASEYTAINELLKSGDHLLFRFEVVAR